LIAHELTHVVQQSSKSTLSSSPIQRRMAFKTEDLEGSISARAKVKGFFGKSSTFSKIKNLLTKYENANAPSVQKTILNELRALAQSWLDKHTDDPQKRASLEKMIPAIDQELIIVDQKLASDESYLQDLGKNNFKFLTTSGQEASDLSGVGKRAKKNAESSGLTNAELTAIRVYTAQDYAYMNPILAKNKGWLDFKIQELVKQGQIDLGGRTVLNDQERIQVQEEANRHSDKAVEGLKKLPDISQEVYRGVGLTTKEFEDQYKNSAATVTFPSFSSTSLDKEVSRGFAEKEAKGGKVGLLLIMQVTKGKDIGDLSLYWTLD